MSTAAAAAAVSAVVVVVVVVGVAVPACCRPPTLNLQPICFCLCVLSSSILSRLQRSCRNRCPSCFFFISLPCLSRCPSCFLCCLFLVGYLPVCLARIAGGVCADFGGARAGDPDPRAFYEEDPPGRGGPQPHAPCVLRVVSREAWFREGAHLQGRRVSIETKLWRTVLIGARVVFYRGYRY